MQFSSRSHDASSESLRGPSHISHTPTNMAKKDKTDKKRKHDKVDAAAAGPSTGAGFSLFGAPKDADLDSVFSKSVSRVVSRCM